MEGMMKLKVTVWMTSRSMIVCRRTGVLTFMNRWHVAHGVFNAKWLKCLLCSRQALADPNQRSNKF